VEKVSKSRGKVYYFNMKTKESVSMTPITTHHLARTHSLRPSSLFKTRESPRPMLRRAPIASVTFPEPSRIARTTPCVPSLTVCCWNCAKGELGSAECKQLLK
jgi:hypothetical protein